MKIKNNLKLSIILGTFVALMFSVDTPVEAGLYGSSSVLPTTEPEVIPEVHEPVDAGIADMAPQLVSSFIALSGVITTSVLIKKTK